MSFTAHIICVNVTVLFVCDKGSVSRIHVCERLLMPPYMLSQRTYSLQNESGNDIVHDFGRAQPSLYTIWRCESSVVIVSRLCQGVSNGSKEAGKLHRDVLKKV
jgi:hypothetical protein